MLIPKRPPKTIVSRDGIHVDLCDFSRSEIALKKRWNAGIGFQDTKKYNRCPGNLKTKVVRYVLSCRYAASLHVDLGSGKCANLSWKLKRLQTLWFDGIGRNNIKPVRERSRDEESVTFGEKTQEEASTG